MKITTHLHISEELCGTPVKIEKDYSLVRLETNEAMKVDDSGLIHGGFIFGAADYAAMLAVNHPNVVLGAAEVQFLKPLRTEDTIYAEAKVIESHKKKRIVSVSVTHENRKVFKGTFTCFVLGKHVLDKS
ncbi:MAG: PaaI family thioesterase [Desulfobacteraceae bacterium]|nr:PaaI family thioesterase [Desulfobacteraceae bacterium]